MKILRAFGFGIFLLIVSVMMPAVFSGFQDTLIVFFDSLQNIMLVANSLESVSAVPY